MSYTLRNGVYVWEYEAMRAYKSPQWGGAVGAAVWGEMRLRHLDADEMYEMRYIGDRFEVRAFAGGPWKRWTPNRRRRLFFWRRRV